MQKAAGVELTYSVCTEWQHTYWHEVPGTFEGHSDTGPGRGRKQTTQDSGGATATTKQTHERTQRIHLNILTISDISTCSTLTINVMSTDEGLTTNRQATVARTHSHAHALTHAHRLSADHRPSTHIIEIYLSQHRANNLAATRIVIEKVERIRQRFFINTNIDKFILRLKCNY